MTRVSTGGAIRYGLSMIVYLIAIYLGGGLLSGVGFALFGAGTGGPFESGNPALLLLGFIFIAVGYLVLLAGTIGIGYKVIADGVATGVDNSSSVASVLEPE